MKILYFAWIKKSLQISEETINPPKNIKNVKSLIQWMSLKRKKHKEVFLKIKSIRIAINHQVVDINKKIKKNDEIAFFPPFTGG